MPVESGYGITEREKQTPEQILSTGLYLGVDLTSYREIQPTTGKALSGFNFVGNRIYGALKPILGRQALPVAPAANQPVKTGLIGNPPLALTRQKLTPTGGADAIIAQGINPQNNGLFFQYLSPSNSGVALWRAAFLPGITYGSYQPPVPSAAAGMFVQASKWTFFSNNDPYAQQYKIDTNQTITFAQIQAPLGTGTIYLGTSGAYSPSTGNILLAAASGLTYVFTYGNGTLESSVNIPVTVQNYSSTGINLNPTIVPYPTVQSAVTNTTLGVVVPISPDTQVTVINIYRIDPSQPQYLFVGSVPNSPGAITPGYTWLGSPLGNQAVFVDNTAIGAVTGYPLVPRRDPPAPFNALFYHKNFMFGFGHPAFTYVYQTSTGSSNYTFGFTQPAGTSDLWFTNQAEPWGWNSVTQVVPVNPNDYADVAVAGGSLGGIAFLCMTRSSWAFYGDSPEDMQQPQQVGMQLGCVSAASFCIASLSGVGTAFWLSNQGVMVFNATTLQCISNDIKEFLDTCSAADLQASVGLFNDGHYYLSFPTKQVSYGYNVLNNMWYPTTFYWSAAFFDLEDPTLRISGGYGALDYVIAVNPAALTTYPLCQMFVGNSDIYATPNAITTTWYSGIWSPPDFSWWGVDYIEIESPVPNVSDLEVTVYITRNPGMSSALTWSKTVSFGQMPSVLVHVPNTVEGSRFQLGVQCVASVDWTLGNIRMWGRKRRKFDMGDST